MLSFVPGFFHATLCLLRFTHGVERNCGLSFLILNGQPSCIRSVLHYMSMLLLMDIWIVSSLVLLQMDASVNTGVCCVSIGYTFRNETEGSKGMHMSQYLFKKFLFCLKIDEI